MAPRHLAHRVHKLMIVLDNTRPKVWRQVEVPSVTLLSDLHMLIQTVMDWEDMHLHVFEFSGRSYSDDLHPDLESLDADESGVRVGDVLRRKGSEGTYTYDLGDEWLHTLTVEEIGDAVPGAVYPRLLDGRGGPPPEDCGGVGSFDHLRHLRDHPEEIESAGGEETEELRFWVGMLEPDDLDLDAERQYLREAFGTLALEEELGGEAAAAWFPVAPARPVSLPSEEELARAATETEVLNELLRFARWFTPARKLTGTGMPRPADVRTVVAEQGLLRPFSEREATERSAKLEKLRAARDLPGFLPLWDRAVDLELIEVGSSTACTAPEAVEDLTTARILELWTEVFEEVVESGPDGTSLFYAAPREQDMLPTLLRMLYDAPDDSDVHLYELVEPLLASVVESQELSSEDLDFARLLFRATVYRGALRLSRTGALALTDSTPAEVLDGAWEGSLWTRLITEDPQDPVPDPGIDCSVALTPLGRYGIRQFLLRDGVPAPLKGHLAEAGAAELLDALVMAAPENHRDEFMPWLERRTAAEAVEQIVEAAAESPEASAVRRAVAQEVLAATGDQGLKDLRAYLSSEHAAVAGAAAGGLLASETCSEEESQRLISGYGPWLAIDMAAAPMELAAPLGLDGDEQLTNLVEFLTVEGSEPGLLGELLLDGADHLWRSSHPATVPVLQALGRVHPDKKRAKAARRAAHKAQSRG